MFDKIKRFFNIKLYTEEQVKHFYEKGIITLEQYNCIINSENKDL